MKKNILQVKVFWLLAIFIIFSGPTESLQAQDCVESESYIDTDCVESEVYIDSDSKLQVVMAPKGQPLPEYKPSKVQILWSFAKPIIAVVAAAAALGYGAFKFNDLLDRNKKLEKQVKEQESLTAQILSFLESQKNTKALSVDIHKSRNPRFEDVLKTPDRAKHKTLDDLVLQINNPEVKKSCEKLKKKDIRDEERDDAIKKVVAFMIQNPGAKDSINIRSATRINPQQGLDTSGVARRLF